MLEGDRHVCDICTNPINEEMAATTPTECDGVYYLDCSQRTTNVDCNLEHWYCVHCIMELFLTAEAGGKSICNWLVISAEIDVEIILNELVNKADVNRELNIENIPRWIWKS